MHHRIGLPFSFIPDQNFIPGGVKIKVWCGPKKDSGAIWPLYSSRAYIEHNKLSSSIRSGLYIERRYAKRRKEEENKKSLSLQMLKLKARR
jgi:hypothetical protein